jgi:hypothetical protein
MERECQSSILSFTAFSQDYRTIYVSKLEGGVRRIDVKSVIAGEDLPNGFRPSRRKR